MLAIGSPCLCAIDGELRQAVVIESRVSQTASNEFDYYLHFNNSDRRLDQWINQSNIQIIQQNEEIENSQSNEIVSKTLNEIDPNSERRVTRAQIEGGGQQGNLTDDDVNEKDRDENEKARIKNIEKIILSCPSLDMSLVAATNGEENSKTSTPPRFEFSLSSCWELSSWYYSPYPAPFNKCEKLFLCGFCFFYCVNEAELIFHWSRDCQIPHPPGTEIYRNEKISVFEIDGEQHRIFCQRLCLFSKLFIEHKTAVFDVEPFLFYITGEWINGGFNTVAYFSKEKYSAEANNVACILTWPQHQRKGYGRFLIELSYQLSIKEGKPGSPEKPLSDLGLVSYRRYWINKLFQSVASHSDGAVISVDDVSLLTGIRRDDLILIAREFDLIRYVKGQHCLHCNNKKIEALKIANKNYSKNSNIKLEEQKLIWTTPTFPKKQRGLAV